MQSRASNGTIVSAPTSKPLTRVTSSVIRLVRKHYILSGVYVIGLILAVIGSGLSVTAHQRSLYEERMSHAISITATDISQLNKDLRKFEQLYYANKGWFSCDETCTKFYNRCEEIRVKLNNLKQKRDSVLLEGKQAVGAWSVYGIQDLRSAFWQAWEDGKEAARRMTMLDAMFIGIGTMTGNQSDRDNSFLVTLLRISFQFVANLTVGLFTSLVVFIVEAWYIISSYGPSFISRIALFALTIAASGSVVTTAIGGIAGATVGGMYWLAHNAQRQALQESRNRRLHYD
jgi:hypothetical protein